MRKIFYEIPSLLKPILLTSLVVILITILFFILTILKYLIPIIIIIGAGFFIRSLLTQQKGALDKAPTQPAPKEGKAGIIIEHEEIKNKP